MQCKRCQRFGNTQRNYGYAPRCVACGGPTSVMRIPTPSPSLITPGGHAFSDREKAEALADSLFRGSIPAGVRPLGPGYY